MSFSPQRGYTDADATGGKRDARWNASAQLMEQEPGPRGSPQWPQAPAVSTGRAVPPVRAANTDERRSSSVLVHDGHWSVSLPRTSSSKL